MHDHALCPKPTQERTPGVGSEEGGEKLDSEDDVRSSSAMEEGERTKLRERQTAIEADLERACQEEDYERAGMPLH